MVQEMCGPLKAVRYKNLDEARSVLSELSLKGRASVIFDDDGKEPQGLLSVIPEDRLDEEDFFRLFGRQEGTLVEVEKIKYSGFGPPAEEEGYMGYISEQCAYVLAGCRLPIEIENCPLQAQDIHHLEAQVLDGHHPLDREHLATELGLTSDWDFDDLFTMILQGSISAEEIDHLIHRGPEG
jgi:hypothetical protein